MRLAFLTLYTLVPEKVLEKICSQPLKMKDEFDKLAVISIGSPVSSGSSNETKLNFVFRNFAVRLSNITEEEIEYYREHHTPSPLQVNLVRSYYAKYFQSYRDGICFVTTSPSIFPHIICGKKHCPMVRSPFSNPSSNSNFFFNINIKETYGKTPTEMTNTKDSEGLSASDKMEMNLAKRDIGIVHMAEENVRTTYRSTTSTKSSP